MLGRSLNRSLYLSLRKDNVITRFNTIYLQTQRGSSVRLFTVTRKLRTTEVVSSNNTDTSSNLKSEFLLGKDPIKVENETNIKFRKYMDYLSKSEQWESIPSLCENIKNSNIKPDIYIYNTILHAYIPLGSIKNSLKILEDMKLANVNPNLTTYNHLLRTYAEAPYSEQDPHLREQIFEMIIKDGFQPDLNTYECYIESILAGEEYERAFELFDSLKSKNIYPQMSLYIAMIRKAIAINEPELALNYLKNLEQNQLIFVPDSLYNDVLRLCAYEYYADGVLYCWNKLQHRKLDLDEGACIDILYFAGNYGKPDLASQVIEYLMDVRKLKLEKYHFIPLIQAYVKIKDIKNAMKSLSIIRQAGFRVGLFDANGIFPLIRKDEKTIDDAYYCLEELHNEGTKIDVAALNVIITACSNIGNTKSGKRKVDVVRALETYKAAEKLGIMPNTETFNSLLLICYHLKQKDLAGQLWKEMQELKVAPSAVTYTRMINVHTTQNDYEGIFFYLEDMKSKNLLPPQEVYETIIKKCVLNGDTRAILALEEMEGFNYKLSRSLRSKLLSAGFDTHSFKENISERRKQRNQRKISSSNDNRVETSTPVKGSKDSDAMDDIVDIISSLKVNENEQKIN